ncbi:MAG: oligosaccharide flippase family protein [Patescibacteria group bacterium]
MADSELALDLELIKKKAISGVVTFTLRTFFVQIFTFTATFVLTILLAPSVFGVFFVVSAFINFFVYFSDIGLAAALIQKKENPTKDDLKTTFTIQQIIIFTLVALGLLFSSKIASFYNLDESGLTLLRVLIISLILSSLKTIPSIILERDLNFTKLVIPQIAENIIFYTTAVILAMNKFGISSFSWAILARGLAGLVTVYVLSPWKPSFGINRISAKQLTSFGVPFQINSILAILKDDLLTIFLGKILTFSQLGYIGWSQKWAFTPLRFFMDNVNKVTFPTYARLQEHSEELKKAIEKSIFFVTFLVYPSVFGIVAIAPFVLKLVPSYEKWQPALPLLYWFSINALFSAVSTTFTNTLFAIGKPKIVLKYMAFWTFATWALTVPLIFKFGYVGVGIGSAIVSTTSVTLLYFVNKSVKVNILGNIFGPLIISTLMFVVTRFILSNLSVSFSNLILAIICGAIIYFMTSVILFRSHLQKDFKVIVKSLINK